MMRFRRFLINFKKEEKECCIDGGADMEMSYEEFVNKMKKILEEECVDAGFARLTAYRSKLRKKKEKENEKRKRKNAERKSMLNG